MVEYLIDVADRRSIQSIFTTHSEDALSPLPSEAIWSSIDGKVRQGRISIEALRAITGRIDEQVAIFVEDVFAKEWVEGLIRNALPDHGDEIGVYAVSGDGQAYGIHMSHRRNPAISDKLKSLCLLDGDSTKAEAVDEGVIKLPGEMPEAEVFNYVRNNIYSLSMRLAVALHLPAEKETKVKQVVESISLSNRDPHLLFNQVGQALGFIPSAIVSSAFISLWVSGNEAAAKRVTEYIRQTVETAVPPS